jgi:glucose/arabinose dehydrogenase/PKD repeat protein
LDDTLTFLRRLLSVLAAVIVAASLLPLTASPVAADTAASVPSNFRDELVWSGLTHPTAVGFTPGGRAFVAQKNGKIVSFDSLTDTSATQIADLSQEVYDYWDRGLLGLAVDPNYGPSRPYIYVLYTYDRILGQPTTPVWNDACPSPPGPTTNGCQTSGRLSRLTVSNSGNGNSVTETPLIWDWCQQYPSHSIGTIAFGPEGALYVSGGDGASFNTADYGQLGGNPCGDPSNEGGALRSQDIRTSSDPTTLDGAVLRVDPDTGDAWPDNANAGSSDANKARIIAYGFRNPFRFTFRANGDIWVGDVGYNTWEEINEITNPDAAPTNFGWPCWEGNGPLTAYMSLGLPLCNNIGTPQTPAFTFAHGTNVVSGDGCGTGSSAIAGLTFLGDSTDYPDSYDSGLFFTDYNRRCIWFAPKGSNGKPDFGQLTRFANLRRSDDGSILGVAVWLGTTQQGDLLYTHFDRGEVRAIRYYAPGAPPSAAFTATPSNGTAPLAVHFDASSSSDSNGSVVAWAWDFDGDGQFDDGNGEVIDHTFTDVGNVNVGLKVTDNDNQTDTAFKVISAGNSAPVPTISAPSASLTWAVGDDIAFSGSATDAQDGTLPASAFHWSLKIEHCPSNCHEHEIETFDDVKTGSFAGPDHDYPSYLRLSLTVTDSDGLSATTSRDIQPKTGTISATSSPSGIPVTLDDVTGAPPPTATGIVGGPIEVAADATISVGETDYAFDHWSDGGALHHEVITTSAAQHLTAYYDVTSTTDAANTCTSAVSGPVSNAWRDGRLGTGTDVDWYRFTTTSTRSIQILLGDLPQAASLKLYKGCSTLLATADRSSFHSEEIIKSLPKGSYAIKISAKGTGSTDSYAFRIRRLASGLSVLSATSQIDATAGTLTLVGEVWNEYASTRGPITVKAKLYDADGHLLATRSASTVLYAVGHSRTPFRIAGSLPAGFTKVSYSVSAPVANKTVRGVTSDTTSSGFVGGKWQAKGTIKASKGGVKWLKVALTLYDKRGTVVDVVRGTVGKSTLSKNKKTTFSAASKIAGLSIDRAKVRTFGFKP